MVKDRSRRQRRNHRYGDVAEHWLHGSSGKKESRSLLSNGSTLYSKDKRSWDAGLPLEVRQKKTTANGTILIPIGRISGDVVYFMGRCAPYFFRIASFGCYIDYNGKIDCNWGSEQYTGFGWLWNTVTALHDWCGETEGDHNATKRAVLTNCNIPRKVVHCYRPELGGNFKQANHDAFDYLVAQAGKALQRSRKVDNKQFYIALIDQLLGEAEEFAKVEECSWKLNKSQPVKQAEFFLNLTE